MIKERLLIIIICLIILCIGLTGCEKNKSKVDFIENQPTRIIEKNGTSISDTSQSPTDIEQTETSNFRSKDSIDIIDYNQYLKKIWIVDNWNNEIYDYFSFFISKIENGVIEGKLKTYDLAIPDFYFFRLKPSKYLGNFSGTISNGVAECQFSDKVGNKGNVTLVFKENNEIEATIEYTEKESAYDDISLDGNYLFRPYNLADIKEFDLIEEHSFAVDLNSWGSVNFVSVEFNRGNVVFPIVYLTNANDDILYEFNVFQTGSEIIDASIKDLNGDGLKDILITTGFSDPDIEHIEWIFFQMDDGLFCDSTLNGEMKK